MAIFVTIERLFCIQINKIISTLRNQKLTTNHFSFYSFHSVKLCLIIQKMKKKQQTNDLKNLEYLQKKYEAEKTILSNENSKLKAQLTKEIQANNLLKLTAEKKEQRYQQRIEELSREMETVKNNEFRVEQPEDEDYGDDLQIALLEIKKISLQLVEQRKKYYALDQRFKELAEEYSLFREENHHSKEATIQTTKQLSVLKKELSSIREDRNKLKGYIGELEKDSEQYVSKQLNLEDELQEARAKLSEEKKKKKELTRRLDEMEDKGNHFRNTEVIKFEERLTSIKQEKERLEQDNMALSTKIQFLKLDINQKTEYIHKIEENEKEREEKLRFKEEKISKILSDNEDERKRLKMEIECMKAKTTQETQELLQKCQEEKEVLKKKLADEFYSILKGKDPQRCQRTLESYIDGLRNCRSQTNFNELNKFMRTTQVQEMQKLRQEQQLSSEISIYKGQIQHLNAELIKAKKLCEEFRSENSDKNKAVAELKHKIDKNEQSKNQELLSLRNDLIALKEKQTQLLELKRYKIEFEEALSLKIQYYENKYREIHSNLERKQSIIEKLKNNRYELEEKYKIAETKLLKAREEAQQLKRLKNDCTRKDELMREYRQKYEKNQEENKKLRTEVDQQKKEKQKFERHLESTTNQLQLLKAKNEREMEELELRVQNKMKETQAAKDFRLNYEQKLKKMKRQMDSVFEILARIKDQISHQVLNSMRKQNTRREYSPHQKPTKKGQWEAAKLLGLKSSELDEFLNPVSGLEKGIMERLNMLWDNENYVEFVKEAIDYFQQKSKL